MLVLIACVMKADGRVLKSEVEFIKPYLQKLFGDEDKAVQGLQILRRLLNYNIDSTGISGQIKSNINYSTRLEMVHLLIGLAYADGDFDIKEEDVIRRIAAEIGVTEADYDSLAASYKQACDKDWAYKVLEINPSATDEEVRRAYRRMVMKYHPDKVTTAAEEMREQATEKFRVIKEAYEHIKSSRGMQ